MKRYYYLLTTMILAFCSCENQDWEFDDYDYTTTYFAYQSPIRVLVMGDDVYDTSLDNQHKCKIMATSGGAYKNTKNIHIDFSVDNSLCNNLFYSKGGKKVSAMPSEYYELASNRITIPSGSLMGGVEVKLTDKFFQDPEAINTTYVIPLVMNSAQNVDSILRGKASPVVPDPNRVVADNWQVRPKDYILYAVRYINQWHGNYLRRGVDNVTMVDGSTSQNVRHQKYVEKDEVCGMGTRSLDVAELALSFRKADNSTVNYNLMLSFDDNGNCTVSSDKYPASGSGKFVKKGDKNSWGNKDRDAIYLQYQIDLGDVSLNTTDTLVIRDRATKMETFDPVFN